MDDSKEMPSLTSYLSRVRGIAFGNATPTRHFNGRDEKITLVMGNPSADLDSFISAVVVSYFFNLRSSKTTHTERRPRVTYVPILNLPTVRANELWRLRPEFGVAVRLALGDSPNDIGSAGGDQGKTSVLEQLVTIGDVKADEGSPLHTLFLSDPDTRTTSASGNTNNDNVDEKQPLFLVDHNAPSIPGLSDETIRSRFTVVGCIDHHVEEDYVPRNADPRVITPGIGSCTSLVVQHLRDQGMWPSISSTEDPASGLAEVTKLALAPILIDTANLKAQGDKCSDTDRDVVRFLESSLPESSSPSPSRVSTKSQWDRDAFFTSISAAKTNSLTLLTMQEVLDRDYKAWSEPSSSLLGDVSRQDNGTVNVNIGISSLVKPLSWLIKHAGGVEAFLEEIGAFVGADERKLGVYCMLTRAGERKEVVVFVFGGDDGAHAKEGPERVLEEFERRGGDLKLEAWDADEALVKALRARFQGTTDTDIGNGKGKWKGAWKIYWMGDTSKSRKQVGPYLREAVRSI